MCLQTSASSNDPKDNRAQVDAAPITDWRSSARPEMSVPAPDQLTVSGAEPKAVPYRLRYMKGLLMTACFALLTATCTSGPASDATTTSTPNTSASSEVAGTVEALRIDGVWVFQHQPGEVSLTALHGGVAEIKNECLYVDDAIVVWRTDQIDQAAQAIADVQAGEQPDLRIGGGGISIDEGAAPEDIPSVITERCPTTTVWYGNP